MNPIVQLFQPDQPVLPDLIEDTYYRSNAGLEGFKKFVVGYYVRSSISLNRMNRPRIFSLYRLSLAVYPSVSRTDVMIHCKDIQTEIPPTKHRLFRPGPKEHRDTETSFYSLKAFLRKVRGGTMRRRRHLYNNGKLCFSFMI